MSDAPGRIFDLADRVTSPDPFQELEQCREFDRTMRTQLIIPMQHLMKLLDPYVSTAKDVLEVGCGPGLVSLRLAAANKQAEFMAVDSNDLFLEVSRENAIFANLVAYGGRFNCDYARLTRLPFEDDSFDVVFSFCSIPRWERPEKTIAECARVCRPGGMVIIYDLARDADEGMISFVLQYSAGDAEQFMRSLRSGYSVPEMQELLTGLGLGSWSVAREGINLVVSSRPLGVGYVVGEPGIYENIFSES